MVKLVHMVFVMFGVLLFYLMHVANCTYSFIGNICKIIGYTVVSIIGSYEPVILYTVTGAKILTLSKIKNGSQHCMIYSVTKVGMFQYYKAIRRFHLNQDGSASEWIMTEAGTNPNIGPYNGYIRHWLPLRNKQKRLWMVLCGARPFEYKMHDLFGLKGNNVNE